MSTSPAFQMQQASVAFGSTLALQNICITAEAGDCLAVVGPNGAGKSTLLRLLLGLAPLRTGCVKVFGNPPAKSRHLIAYMPQKDTVDWRFPATVADVVLMGRWCHMGYWPRPSATDWQMVHDALTAVGLDHLANKPIAALSGGQQQRIFLARLLARDARLLLLDEPFNGLDAATQHLLLQLLEKMAQEGRTILTVLHDLRMARRFSQVLLLNKTVVAAGSPETVLQPDLLTEAYFGCKLNDYTPNEVAKNDFVSN